MLFMWSRWLTIQTWGDVASGRVFSFGRNSKGQLGRTTGGIEDILPGIVNAPANLLRVYAGEDFVVGLLKNGSLIGWGSNSNGVLGQTPAALPSVSTPVLIPSSVLFTSVSVGAQHVVACGDDGGVYTWGRSRTGELGTGSPFVGVRSVPTRVTAGALAGNGYVCQTPLAGWNSSIIVLHRKDTAQQPCIGVMFGRNYKNSLPISDADGEVENTENTPIEDNSLCYGEYGFNSGREVMQVQDIGYRYQHGFSLYSERNVSTAYAIASWGPMILGELMTTQTIESEREFGADFFQGTQDTIAIDTFLYRRHLHGPARIFVGATAFMLVTSEKHVYVWGIDPTRDILLQDPSGPSLENLPYVDAPIRLDPLGLISSASIGQGIVSRVSSIKTFMPIQGETTMQTTIILSESWRDTAVKIEIQGDWWDLEFNPTRYQNPKQMLPDDGILSKLHSWAVGGKHILVLADCQTRTQTFRCLLGGGDPENYYGALGYDDIYYYDPSPAAFNLLQMYPNDDTVPEESRLTESSMSLLAAGPTSSWVVVNGNQLWWWGEWATQAEYYPVRLESDALAASAAIVQLSIGYRDNGFLIDSLGGLYSFGVNTVDDHSGYLCAPSLGSIAFTLELTLIHVGFRHKSVYAGGDLVVVTTAAPSAPALWTCGSGEAVGLGPTINASNNGFVASFTVTNFPGVNSTNLSIAVGNSHAIILANNQIYSYAILFCICFSVEISFGHFGAGLESILLGSADRARQPLLSCGFLLP